MFVGILLRDLARDFRVEFWELAPSCGFQNRFERGQKTIGGHLKRVTYVRASELEPRAASHDREPVLSSHFFTFLVHFVV